jgi:hypothetical protein
MDSIWQIFWVTIEVFVFVAWLMVLFMIITDMFRDHTLAGGWKAVWIFFLILIPFITALIYLIARGGGMNERARAAAEAQKSAADAYIRDVSAGSSSAEQIKVASDLLASGHITQEEFDQLKAKALS